MMGPAGLEERFASSLVFFFFINVCHICHSFIIYSRIILFSFFNNFFFAMNSAYVLSLWTERNVRNVGFCYMPLLNSNNIINIATTNAPQRQ